MEACQGHWAFLKWREPNWSGCCCYVAFLVEGTWLGKIRFLYWRFLVFSQLYALLVSTVFVITNSILNVFAIVVSVNESVFYGTIAPYWTRLGNGKLKGTMPLCILHAGACGNGSHFQVSMLRSIHLKFRNSIFKSGIYF